MLMLSDGLLPRGHVQAAVDRGEPMILFNFLVKMQFLPPTFGLSCN
jgi:hypothetical protein